MSDDREPFECSSDRNVYDEDTEDVLAGGRTIAKAEENAKKKAKKAAKRAAKEALDAAEDIGDSLCKKPCEAWFKVEIGVPDAQGYPYHGDKRQFAFGWCDWKVIVKCVNTA
jgi:hypothetical protein